VPAKNWNSTGRAWILQTFPTPTGLSSRTTAKAGPF